MAKNFLWILGMLVCSQLHTYAQAMDVADQLLLNTEFEKAIVHIDNELLITKDPAVMLSLENKKAEALIRQGRFDAAEKLLKSLEQRAKSGFQIAVTQTNYGLLYLNQGRNDLALEALQNAIREFDADNKSETLEAAQAIAYLGNLYRASGKYAQAEEQLNRTLTLRQKKLKDTHELIAATYNDLGLVFSSTDPDKALEYYEKAYATYLKLHGKDHPKIAIANTNMGFVYNQLELYGDAVNNFESSLRIYEKVYAHAHPSRAFVLFNLGQTYQKIGNWKSAMGFYQRAVAMYKESYGLKHPEIARVYNAIGSLHQVEGHYDSALHDFQEALKANVSDFQRDDIIVNPPMRNYYDGNVLLYSLLYKAQAFEVQHFSKTLRFSNLTRALATLQLADSLIDKLRQQITNESDKIALGSIATEVYADGVRIARETGLVALKRKPYFAQAFYFAEKSKSAVLLEAISDANAKSFAGIPNDLLEEERNLKSAIALCAQKLAQKPSPEEEKYLRDASFSLNRNYEAFIKKLEQQFPEYFNLKFNSAAASIHQLQAQLNDETALLSYFIDEKNRRLYIFNITKDRYTITDHALPKDFDRYITGMRNGIYFNELKIYAISAQHLSALLIPNIHHRIKDLVVLATGRLSAIPFETLLTNRINVSTANYQTLPYLINSFAIRYEFSASLVLQKTVTRNNSSPSILLCAPVVFPDKDNLPELPGTALEVKEIAAMFAEKNLDHALFTHQQADEKLIKSDVIEKYNIIHLATHGIVDELNPDLSRIFLQSDVGSEDGNLFAGEIYNLNLKANLVTLSACQTGLGKISKGEGVIGLSRALVYAGAQSIVVSFWSVADESTAELMKDFYKQTLATPKRGFSGSLREAKVDMIRQEKFAAPYYWAPFILIGF